MMTIKALGEFGALDCTTTTAQTGTWFAFTCFSGTVFATLTDLSVTRVGTIASVAFPAGITVFGAFTNFTLTSGSVRFYKSKS